MCAWVYASYIPVDSLTTLLFNDLKEKVNREIYDVGDHVI